LKDPKAYKLTALALQKAFLWLFLDYDGTLAEFTPNPETIESNPKIVSLLKHLTSRPHLRLTLISGRCLRDLRSLAPVPGVHLAGTYGVELLISGSGAIQRVDHDVIRPLLDMTKLKWVALIDGKSGFYIEDKGLSLALHAHFSMDEEALQVLLLARKVVERELPKEYFRILGGHKFLEAAPLLAHKGKTVEFLLRNFPLPDAQLIYIGDDDKDEEAFETIIEHGGIAIKVINNAQIPHPTCANFTLESPSEVLFWLESFVVGR